MRYGFVVAAALALAQPAIAQQVQASGGRAAGGVHSFHAADATPADVTCSGNSCNITFGTVTAGTTVTQDCFFQCFSNTTECDSAGTVQLQKSLSAPFSVTNFRKNLVSDNSCSGTPVSLPVSLNPGEQLLMDFNFSPTHGGSFSDTLTLSDFNWNLSGNSGGTSSGCVDSGTQMCLNGNRFAVTATFRTADGTTGAAHMVKLTADTGYMWFFSQSNVEAVAKVLNGCGLTGAYWFFAGGLTDVRVVITVDDTSHPGHAVQYINRQGNPFQPIQDTGAFPFCP